jgi:hypothetical protein
MEQFNQIEIDLEKEDLSILKNAFERFKSTYRVDFEIKIDNNKLMVLTKDLDPDLIFNLGYYYGALRFIDDNKPKDL